MTTEPTRFTLNTPWFELVQSGLKIYEGRRRTPRIKALVVGDEITIAHHTDQDRQPYTVIVEEILEFPNFEIALTSLPIEQVLPVSNITVVEGLEIYKKYVSLPTQERDGVTMIKIRVK